MDSRLFEKSPKVAPLLVRLYDSHKLYELATDDTPLARAELTSAVADLLEAELAPREKELISDVLISLMRQAEKDLREALSERLSVIDTVPLRIALHLANDDISVAAPVLKKSNVLSDMDLLYIIKAKTSAYWQAIAGRRGMSEQLINVLADTRDVPTAGVLVRNDAIHLPVHAMSVIGEMVPDHEELAKPLLMRQELPEDIARRLYSVVGAELKHYIRDYFGAFAGPAADAVDDVMLEFGEAIASATRPVDMPAFMPGASMIAAAKAYKEKGRLSVNTMMDTLQRGQYASFIAMFAEYAGMDVRTVHDMVSEAGGHRLAVACKALGVQKTDMTRFYMLTQRVRSADRIIDQSELLSAIRAYDKVTVTSAQGMMGMSR